MPQPADLVRHLRNLAADPPSVQLRESLQSSSQTILQQSSLAGRSPPRRFLQTTLADASGPQSSLRESFAWDPCPASETIALIAASQRKPRLRVPSEVGARGIAAPCGPDRTWARAVVRLRAQSQ